MINMSLINNFFQVFISVLFVLLLFITIYLLGKKNSKNDCLDKIDELYLKIKNDINYSIAPEFINKLSLGVNDLIDLAVEVWRIEQRIIKSASSLPEQQLKGLENSVQKLKRYLSKYDFEILDYKNQKYNDGLNLDILSIEKDLSLAEPVIKETVEPTILCKGQVVRKAKIILINNH